MGKGMNRLESFFNAKKQLNLIDTSDIAIEVDEITKRKLQETILKMYIDILQVCNKYQITPFLTGGSCLGAIRHKGFIPWDDDLDVGMTRADYLIFRKHFDKELSSKYVLNAPNDECKAKTRFIKIMKKGTICREIGDDYPPEECGIFLDIFLIEDIPQNKVIRTVKGSLCNLLEFIASQVYTHDSKDPDIRKLLRKTGLTSYAIRTLVGTLFSFNSASEWFDRVDKMASWKPENTLYGFPTGRKHYFGEIFDRSVFFPPRSVEFCGIQAPVFNDTDTYLKNLYGDYMQIPPVEKREKHFLKELSFGADE